MLDGDAGNRFLHHIVVRLNPVRRAAEVPVAEVPRGHEKHQRSSAIGQRPCGEVARQRHDTEKSVLLVRIAAVGMSTKNIEPARAIDNSPADGQISICTRNE